MTTPPPGTGPPTTAPRVAEPSRVELDEPDTSFEPLYHLILLDDDDHSYQYVIEMLAKVLGYGREKAFALAAIVDNAGQVVMETASHEQVTGHQQEVHAYGADPRIPHCKGSMSAIVEPVDAPELG
jgi:ATP-dependent Clp protease adaptor protein ClpS